MLSVSIGFWGVFVSAVDMSFMPVVSNAWVIAMFFMWVIVVLFIRVIAVLFKGLRPVAVMIVPPAVMIPVSGVPIDPFMIPV